MPKICSQDRSNVNPEDRALDWAGSIEVPIEPIVPDLTLVLFGAGPVSRALGEIAGWPVSRSRWWMTGTGMPIPPTFRRPTPLRWGLGRNVPAARP